MDYDLIHDLIKESNYVKYVALFALMVSFLSFGSTLYLFHLVQQ